MLLGKALTEKGFAVTQPQVRSTERHGSGFAPQLVRTNIFMFFQQPTGFVNFFCLGHRIERVCCFLEYIEQSRSFASIQEVFLFSSSPAAIPVRSAKICAAFHILGCCLSCVMNISPSAGPHKRSFRCRGSGFALPQDSLRKVCVACGCFRVCRPPRARRLRWMIGYMICSCRSGVDGRVDTSW